MTTTSTIKSILISSITALAIAYAGAGFAASVDDEAAPQAQINVANTDFSSAAAVKKLQSAVRTSARHMCFEDTNRLPSQDESACYNAAIQSGLAQIEERTNGKLSSQSITTVAEQSLQSSVRTSH